MIRNMMKIISVKITYERDVPLVGWLIARYTPDYLPDKTYTVYTEDSCRDMALAEVRDSIEKMLQYNNRYRLHDIEINDEFVAADVLTLTEAMRFLTGKEFAVYIRETGISSAVRDALHSALDASDTSEWLGKRASSESSNNSDK